MLLFFIRHGDPNYFPDQLTPLGHRQAEAVAKRLALYGLDEIYSSSAVRAKETAQPHSAKVSERIWRRPVCAAALKSPSGQVTQVKKRPRLSMPGMSKYS